VEPVPLPPRLVRGTLIVPAALASTRLDELVVRLVEVDRADAERLRREGRVRIDGRAIVDASPRVAEGARLEVLTADADPGVLPEAIPLPILYATENLLVVNKPAMLAMSPGTKHPAGTLANALRGLGCPLSAVEGEGRPGIVHRLDRGTSGALLVAKDDLTHRALALRLAARAIHRGYVALVHGSPAWEERAVDAPIAASRAGRKSRRVHPEGRPARTVFRVCARYAGMAVVLAHPETGRTHQIRVHLAWLGHPILGDTLYAGDADRSVWGALGVRRPCLHASRITFDEVDVSAPLPEDLAAAIARASGSGGRG
jgi:23S rRNA pseudouridine1911/1915/1917 synthase